MRGLAAQHLLPGPGDDIEFVPWQGHGECGRGGIANDQALALSGYPGAIGHPYARGRAIPGKHDVTAEIDIGKVGQLAIGCLELPQIRQAQLLGHIGEPALSEALPGKHVDAP